MKEKLLTTKSQMPPLPAKQVMRPRLTKKLNAVEVRKVTLVTAPAGFGKTTLVREWVESAGCETVWLALDEQDNNPARFLLYLIYALREITPEIGNEALALLQSGHQPHLSAILTLLVNELVSRPDHLVLILNDYHVITDQTIHDAISFLIAHLPANIHLLLTSRSQPPLNLARLRSQAQLLELDSADLRFTAIEVEHFLSDVMQLELSPHDRIALEMRTEGWIAGLQLAALSLQGQIDASGFIAAFNGTDRHVADYLFEEVIRHQPDEVRHFLLHTSVVDSLCSELCDSLLQQSGTQAMLERLDQLHLFIVPLDNQRQWFRYHPLFVDLLRHYFNMIYPEQVSLMHARASLWYEHHNRSDEAIRHGLQAQQYERTAALIEAAFQQRDWIHHDMRRLLGWFDSLPTAVTHARPALTLAYCWLMLEIFSDRWQLIESQLQQVEQILTSSTLNAAFGNQDRRLMLAQIDLLRANHARQAGDYFRVIELCQQTLARLPENEMYIRSGTIAHLASAYASLGSLIEANRMFSQSVTMCRTANNIDGLLFASAHFIESLTASGQLREAERVFEQARLYTDQRSGPDVGVVYISIAEVYREQNKLELAKTYFERGIDLCRPFEAWRDALVSGVIGLARVLAAADETDEAIIRLVEIEKQDSHAIPPNTTRLDSVRARLYLMQGKFNAAARWANHSGLAAIDEIDYDYEFDILTTIRVLLTQAKLETQAIPAVSISADPFKDADRLLKNLYDSALAGGRTGRVIEIGVLQALFYGIKQETNDALKRLAEALDLAEGEGYVRLFVNEGQPMYQLLTTLRTRPILASISADYVDALREAFPVSVRQPTTGNFIKGSGLTESEHSTLRLLASERSMEEIATELSVAVSTVRTYAKRIYSKLDAHSRAEAVYRARELNLL